MGRSLGKHCAYHNEDGHMTQGCRALKAHLEDLVRQGQLRDLVDETRTREEQYSDPGYPFTVLLFSGRGSMELVVVPIVLSTFKPFLFEF